MTLPQGMEITDLIQAHWNLLALQLPPAQQALLRGPRTEAQGLSDL
ncbi:MAG: hypothetical protein HGA45_02865 [Chloroflexales bacterium]|nr:hypothetical protein [Chloroflexales bacterium]